MHDDRKTSSNQTNEFWTRKTVFCYGQDGPDKFKQFAMASKARPGPHRDKREAKKEAKAAKFRGLPFTDAGIATVRMKSLVSSSQ